MKDVFIPERKGGPSVYEAGQELADILIQQGFQDCTAVDFPKEYVKFKDGDYNPLEAMRCFHYPGNSGFKLLFDIDGGGSTAIRILQKDGDADYAYNLTPVELKALITFFKMDSSDRNELITNDGVIAHTLYLIEDVDLVGSNASLGMFRLRNIFDTITLNK